MKPKNVLITGANGFLGTHLIRFLDSLSIEMTTIGTAPTDIGKYYEIPFNDRDSILKLLLEVQPDAIFHLAGVSDKKDISEFYQVNTMFACHLIWALKESKITNCPTILIGSSAEYGIINETDLPILETHPANPYDHYGISKLAQTLMGVKEAQNGLPLIMVRPFNIIGPGMPKHLVLQSFIDQIKRIINEESSPILNVGNLSATRDFVYVEDVLESMWRLIQSPKSFGEIINICSGSGTSIGDLLNQVTSSVNVDVEICVDPKKYKKIDVPVHFGSNRKLMELTGFSPCTKIEKSVEKILIAEGIL